jgi:Divergent InlB B-repeat domain
MKNRLIPAICKMLPVVPVMIVATLALLSQGAARASIAYGSINNFDTVNDTGHECHGFEIEIEDCHSTDITYTYNYNHYGAPRIEQDDTIPGHPKCRIRWESKKNADGTWAAYTAIPSGPISPTNGHMFTNPNVNFGGEHFGVGYRVPASVVKYNWLIDNGSGVLVHGGAVQVSTPVFTYYPPVAGNPAPARVQAVIAPPPPPVPPVKQFGKAVWVKEIKTTTHNNREIKLRELVSDDPVNPNDKNWANGEPDEVEVEWRILQKRNIPGGGANDELAAAPEDLPNGNEVVTRRYEFYKYTGPLDAESGEAMADAVGADNLHGSGMRTYNHHMVAGEWVTVTEDMATYEVIGAFTGSQMAAVDVDAPVGLIDHVGEGRMNTAFAPRTVVIEGANPFASVLEGALPAGMTFDEVTGVLDGTPTVSGSFQFKITASDGINPDVSKNYTLLIAAAGAALPPASLLDTTAAPVGSGTATGDGSYAIGANATVTATAAPGFAFLNWTDDGVIVGTNGSYTLVMNVNHSLVANFVPAYTISTSSAPVAGGSTSGGGVSNEGASATVTATANAGYTFTNWTEGGIEVSKAASYTFTAFADVDLVANFAVIGTNRTISTSAAPIAGGSTSGGGTVAVGSSVTVAATANAGYAFNGWTEAGQPVSESASYTFSVTASRVLVANFITTGVGNLRSITAAASPLEGGTITGAGSYADGSSVTLTANNNAGYQFTKWTEGGVQISNVKTLTFTVNASRTLTAVFVPALSIAVSASPPGGGLVEPDAPSYEVGDGADVQAQANPGYTFVNWTEGGVQVSTDAKYIFTITTSRTLVANFISQGNVTIALSGMPAAGGTVSGGGSKVIGAPVIACATAADGFKFTHWSEGGVSVNTDKDYQFTASVNRTLVANFIAIPATGMHETENENEMEFEWPETASGWVLQESADLITWVNSTRQINISSGKKRARISTLNVPGVFFRLVKP